MNIISSFSTRPGRHGRLAFLLLAMLLTTTWGCDKAGKIPGSADARVIDMAEHLPADTPAGFVVGDLKGMRESLKTARDTIGDAVPMTALIEEQAKNEIGLDIFDAKSWEKSGVAADSGMMVSVVGKRPVLITYVNDQQKFEKAFADQLKKSKNIEGMVKADKADGQSVKVLGEGANSAVWTYRGKMVIMAFPETTDADEFASSMDAKDPKELVVKLSKLDKAKSLASFDGYKKFNKALGTAQSMALFVNAKQTMTDENLANFKQSADPIQQATANWAQKNVDAFGIGLNVKGSTLVVRAWMGLPADVIKRAQTIMTPPTKSPVGTFATDNTMAGLRVSVDMAKAWSFYKETLPKEQLDKLTTNLSQADKNAGLNIEEDVINKMTGNLGVLFYGVDKGVVEQANGNLMMAVMTQPIKALAIMVPVQFQDKASLEKVVAALMKTAGGTVTRTPVKDGVEVLKMNNITNKMGQVFLKDDLLVYATDAFSDEAVYKYIAGKRDEKNLAESDHFKLGKKFADDKPYNGLYLNFARAQEQLGDLLAETQPKTVDFLKKLQEASLTSEVTDTGAYLDLTIDLTKQPAEATE